MNPQNASAYAGRGFAYANLGQIEAATKDLDEALRLNPRLAAAYAGRGLIYTHLRQYEEAMRNLDEALRLQPRMPEAFYIRGSVALAQERYDAALKDFTQVLQAGWNPARAYYLRGETYRRFGQEQRAISDATQAIQLRPDLDAAYYLRGSAALRLGQPGNAINDFTEVISRNPSHPIVYLTRSIGYLGLGRPDSAAATDAETHLKRRGWHERNAQFAALLAHLGYRQAGRGVDAQRILDEALAHSGGSYGGGWPIPIVRYFRRELPGDKLVAMATNRGKLTEVSTYIGIDLTRSGRLPEGLKHLAWVKEHGDRRFIEYDLALLELRRNVVK